MRFVAPKIIYIFVKSQQQKYIAHVIRMKLERNVKQLTFNDDKYVKKGRPVKSLLGQVIEELNVTIDGYCNLALQGRIDENQV